MDAVLLFVKAGEFIFFIHPCCFLVARIRAEFTQILTLDALHQHVVALFHGKKKILKYFVNEIIIGVLNGGGREFHNELFNQCSRHVLDQKVVCVAACKVDVKKQG